MNEAQQILQMLQEGKITADEASELLAALQPGNPPPGLGEGRGGGWSRESGEVEEPLQAAPSRAPPDLKRFRRLCQILFYVALGVLVLSGWGLYAVYRHAEYEVTSGFVWMLVLFVLAVGVTAITFWMRMVPWLHVRVQEGDGGKRIAISLPLPLTLAGWGMNLARHFVKDEAVAHLDTAAELLKAMKGSLGTSKADPIAIDVDDDGQRVQVYIG
jgi:hypothetical protein